GTHSVAGGSSRVPVCTAALSTAPLPSRHDLMHLVELLTPENHRRIPWKNGRGELVAIDSEGGESWQSTGVAWHFGRTAITEEGPFSDYAGYERLQVVT